MLSAAVKLGQLKRDHWKGEFGAHCRHSFLVDPKIGTFHLFTVRVFLLTVGALVLTVELLCLQSIELLLRESSVSKEAQF